MILTRKRLLLDIFFTHRLSKLLSFSELVTVNFKPCTGSNSDIVVELCFGNAVFPMEDRNSNDLCNWQGFLVEL